MIRFQNTINRPTRSRATVACVIRSDGIEGIVKSFGRAIAEHRFEPGRLQDVLEFLKRTRSELRLLRKVRVSREWVRIFDVNGDWFEVSGVGYADADVIAVLNAVNTPFNRETIHEPTNAEYKEFLTSRRYAWAADRVM